MKYTARILAIIAATALVSVAQESRPNLLLIMVDDLGPEWISACGGGMKTPRIDEVAAGGMRFTRAYSMPKCTPTRVTLLTGQYPYRHGWVNHWDVPRWGVGCHFDPAKNTTFARHLRDAGYRTAIAGKWQINDFRVQPRVLAEHGFDEWCMWTGGEGGNPKSNLRYQDPYVHTRDGSEVKKGAFGPEVYTSFLIDFMKRHRAEPMMLYFPMALTHTPFVATPLDPDAKGKMDRHRAMVRYTDHCVGRLLDALDELGIAERTAVVLTTDNGTARGVTGTLGTRSVRGGKGTLNESGCRAPFFVRWPGRIEPGSICNAPTDFTDVFPTLLGLAGIEKPKDVTLDGHSLVDVLRGKAERTPREFALTMGGGVARQSYGRVVPAKIWADRALCGERFKMWMHEHQPLHLYDLASDPGETRDLLESTDPVVVAARAKLVKAAGRFPRRDGNPRYDPVPAQPWDLPPPVRFERQVLSGEVGVGYGVAIGDVDGDTRPDVLLVDRREVVWYRNGDWKRFVLAERLTQHDNVCIAARDIDGDGRVEIAVGGQWNPRETNDPERSGAVHWLQRPEDPTRPWTPVRLAHEPTVHRMAWVRVAKDRFHLVVLPLHGRGNVGGEGAAVRVTAHEPPARSGGEWKTFVIDESLHMTHEMDVVRAIDGAEGVVIGGREGLREISARGGKWRPGLWVAKGHGSGEVEHGSTGQGRFTATVEPMHGNELVVNQNGQRRVIAKDLNQGHGLVCGDFLGLGRDQIVVGWRNPNQKKKVGLRLYFPEITGSMWRHRLIDDTIACEDVEAADLDGDGRIDLVAAGRSSHDLVIFWNRSFRR